MLFRFVMFALVHDIYVWKRRALHGVISQQIRQYCFRSFVFTDHHIMQGQDSKSIDSELMDISAMLRETPALWKNYQGRALGITTVINQNGIMRDPASVAWRAYCIGIIQRYATYDHETRRDYTLSTWCEREWHRVLLDDPENVRALTGKATYLCIPPSMFSD